MNRPRSRRPRAEATSDVAPIGKSASELETELRELRAAYEQQTREYEENAESCSQALARISHSERTLSQTKIKLMAAEETATLSHAQINELRAHSQAADERLARAEEERAASAERERELIEQNDLANAALDQQAIELARLRDALAAALREPAWREVETKLRAELAASAQRAEQADAKRQELRELAESLSRDSAAAGEELTIALSQLSEARKELKELTDDLAGAREDREQLLSALGAVETLSQRVVRMSQHARAARSLPPPVESEEERVTMRPVAPPMDPPRSLRRSTAPEILIDGIPHGSL